MPAKKASTKATPKTNEKTCNCKECACSGQHSQLSFYVLIAMLVATMTILVVSLTFNKTVRDLFHPATYVYNGRFETESNDKKNVDENGIKALSAGAVIDMLSSGKTGFLIIGEKNCIGCDAFERRVAGKVAETDDIYRFNLSEEIETDDARARNALGVDDEAPDFLYIREGVVYDRIDDVKDITGLKIFLSKYNVPLTETEQ